MKRPKGCRSCRDGEQSASNDFFPPGNLDSVISAANRKTVFGCVELQACTACGAVWCLEVRSLTAPEERVDHDPHGMAGVGTSFETRASVLPAELAAAVRNPSARHLELIETAGVQLPPGFAERYRKFVAEG